MILLNRAVSAVFDPQEIIYFRCSSSLGGRKAGLGDHVLLLSDIPFKYLNVIKQFSDNNERLTRLYEAERYRSEMESHIILTGSPPHTHTHKRPARLPFQHEVFLLIVLSRRFGQASGVRLVHGWGLWRRKGRGATGEGNGGRVGGSEGGTRDRCAWGCSDLRQGSCREGCQG